jgi:outer membrane protein assembly complex protein YaeT
MQPGSPYFDAQLRADRDAIQQVYDNLGYRNASVEVEPGFNADRTEANPVITVREGPRLLVDHILIAGNFRTRTETIERELQIKEGEPLSTGAVNSSRSRLSALGLFRRVDITELRHGNETTRDLLVTVEEAPPTTVAFGGGVEGRLRVVRRAEDGGIAAEKFEVAPRASFEIGRRNVFGKNRSVNLVTSLSLHPKDSPFFLGQAPSTSSGSFGFPEYRIQGTYREPQLFNTAFDSLVTGAVEQQIRSSFNFARKSLTAQASRLVARKVALSGSYQLQFTKLLDVAVDPVNQPIIDRVFASVRLSSFLVSGGYDTRNDQVDPTAGGYLGLTGQIAGRRIGSDVGFAKSSFTAQVFHLLPRSHATVFAAQARLGLAKGFPRDVTKTDDQGQTVVAQDVQELPEPERFFAGGDATNRGFALDTLGRPATIQNGFPIGGNGLLIFNAELRVPVRGGLQVVGFVDTGNVFEKAGDIALGDLRTSVGFGLRYKSPVGPLRFDMGFKVHREPGEGAHAWFVSFGQAF